MALAAAALSAAWSAACSVALALPLACALACWAWSRAPLPHTDGPAGRRIGGACLRAAWASLGLAGAAALLGGPWSWALWVLDALALAVAWALGSARAAPARRYVRTAVLIAPAFLHYRLLGWWVRHAGLSEEEAASAYEEVHARYSVALVDGLVELGGLFVKLGQLLSLFSNAGIPAVYLRELKRLQSEVPAMSGAEVRRLASRALGRPVDSVFSCFSDEPVGSASLGQVHRARLASDGREVAVKLQYPSVASTLEMDFGWIEWLVERVAPGEAAAAREARTAFLRELDFEAEARALARVHQSLRHAFPAVSVPEPVPELCSRTVLVMTFVPGASVLDSLLGAARLAARLSGRSVEDLFATAGRRATELRPGEEVADAHSGGLPGGAGLVARLVALRLYQAAHNAGAGLCNLALGRLGAPQLPYCQILPSFDPVKVSRTAWQVQGHQLLVDGFFNSDSHPGNFLVDPHSGSVGLIDFGQMCEIGLETRVRFARLIVALAEDDDVEIALQHARLGMRTSRMRAEQLALHARIKYGRITTGQHAEFTRRLAELDREDPLLSKSHDEKMGLVEKMILLLRGTNVFLGVLGKHSAQTMWLGLARSLLEEHGAAFPEPPVALDTAALDGAATLAAKPVGAPAPAAPGGDKAFAVVPGAAEAMELLGRQWSNLPAP